jgi:hypothetical protein
LSKSYSEKVADYLYKNYSVTRTEADQAVKEFEHSVDRAERNGHKIHIIGDELADELDLDESDNSEEEE